MAKREAKTAAATVRLPKYRKHATGQAVVWLGGRDVYLGRYGSAESKREYERLIGEFLAGGRQTPPAASEGPLTVAGLILRYYRHAEARNPRVAKYSIRPALRLFRKRYGHTEAAAFGPVALKALRAALASEGLSRSTVNKYINRVRIAFKWAASEELLPAEVWARLKTVEGLRYGEGGGEEREPVGPVAEANVRAALPYMAAPVRALVELQLATGMRPGEAVRMTAAEIDVSGKVWIYKPRHHKNAHRGQERVVALGPKAQAILKPRLTRDLAAPLFSPREAVEAQGKDGAWTRDGYEVQSYRQAIRNACAKAGVPAWNPNQLRHTAATAVRKAYGLEAAGAVLGHKVLETSQIYAERDLTLALKVAAEVG